MCTGGSMPDNNGNLKKQDNYVPDDEQVSNYHTFTDFFAYDSLNRLQTVTETNYVSATNQTTTPWQQTYIYDRFGNRRIDPSQTWGTGINNTNFSVDQNTNRLGVPSGQSGTMGYDPAGNLTTDTYSGGGGRTYDAENRMITATTGTEFNQYTYDGDGRRVKRNIGEVETWQVYGFGGELLAEYAVNGAPASPQKEYGYRNGQLLITATVTTGWGAAPTLHDNPLQVGVTTVQALHISELRDAINALRSHLGMSAYTWQYSATTSDYISANPIVEMRTALDQALGAPSGGYSAGLAQGQPVKAIHIQELRDRVLGAWITSSSTDLRWLVTDQLGTPRMIFDQSGTLAGVSRHDYLPFGEELVVGQGLRTAAMGYATNDGVRQHFTLKERDNETGLDFFGARYYASAQGRFTSTDPALTSADVATPQSWNRYAYSFNNPLKYIDPTGAWNWSAALGGSDSDEDLRNKAGKDKNALKAANKIVDRRNLFRNGLNAARAAGPRSDEPDTVARAANSYGSEGDSNGVTVTFGTTANGSAADTGPSPDGGLSFDANGTATAQVLVTISDSAKTDTNSLAQDIGHEGWHVADRQSFASYLTRQIQGAGGLANFVGTPLETQAFSSPYNRTVQTTEFNAYIVSGLIAQGRDALGNDFPNSNFNGHEVWNRSWKAAERPGLRAVGAFEQATTSPLYSNRLDHRIFPQ
jgi:RHS repeat-associated protein